MRALSLCITLLGTFVLLVTLTTQEHSLDGARIHDVVYLRGLVKSEGVHGNTHFLTIENRTVVCKCTELYLSKKVVVKGYIEDYNGKNEITALRVHVLE